MRIVPKARPSSHLCRGIQSDDRLEDGLPADAVHRAPSNAQTSGPVPDGAFPAVCERGSFAIEGTQPVDDLVPAMIRKERPLIGALVIGQGMGGREDAGELLLEGLFGNQPGGEGPQPTEK